MGNFTQSIDDKLFDADGFLLSPEGWSEELANRLASVDGMHELSPVQIDLLHTLRDEFKKTGAVTALSHICRLDGQQSDCLQQLFPSPKQAWRLAGLPNPGEEAKAYMSNK